MNFIYYIIALFGGPTCVKRKRPAQLTIEGPSRNKAYIFEEVDSGSEEFGQGGILGENNSASPEASRKSFKLLNDNVFGCSNIRAGEDQCGRKARKNKNISNWFWKKAARRREKACSTDVS